MDDVLDYANSPDSMDYLYDFLEADLPARLAERAEFVPPGFEDILADDTPLDHVWLWIKEPGLNGFRQYLRDGGFDDAEVARAYAACREEWGMNTPPQLEWLEK